MKTAETLLACCVVGLACFIGGQSLQVTAAATQSEAAGAIDEWSPVSLHDLRALIGGERPEPREKRHGAEVLVGLASTALDNRPAVPAYEMRRRLAPGMAGTYMPALLRSRDSALTRWPERTTRPLRVFIREGTSLEGWTPDYLAVVRDAFDTWVQTGIPVRFTFVTDSARADIHVRFTRAFTEGISGRTTWSRNAAYWLVASDIQLALWYPGGGFVTPTQLRAMALHEVGHLLGLDHADSPEHIMSARVRVRDLSEADRATVRLLYAVPAGSLK